MNMKQKVMREVMSAIMSFHKEETSKVVVMAEAVGWHWRGEKIDEFMIQNTLLDMYEWANIIELDDGEGVVYSHYTGGLSIAIKYGEDEEDGQWCSVSIQWGPSSQSTYGDCD